MNHSNVAPVEFAPAEVNVETTPEGGYLLRSPMPLEPYEANLGVMLRRWAKETPTRAFIGERGADGGWRLLSYGYAGRLADAIA